MDYVKIFADACLAFFKNFSFSAVLQAFGGLDFDGIRDAVVSIAEAVQKVI